MLCRFSNTKKKSNTTAKAETGADSSNILNNFTTTKESNVKMSDANKKADFCMEGRRVVDISFYNNQIASITHAGFGCSFKDMEVIGEKCKGLLSTFEFKCKICNKIEHIYSEDPNENCVNNMVTSGAIGIGIGYSQLLELFFALNIPFMAETTFRKLFENLSTIIDDVAWEKMKEAGAEEAKLSRNAGDVDDDGIPITTVVVDGAWSKRSYKSNYNALSGVGCIIGAKSQKVLFAGVRNKYCAICSKGSSTAHTCFKN